MSKKYKIKSDIKCFYKRKLLTNENLTNKIAEELLASGQYNDIIEIITSKKKKENGTEEPTC